MLAVAGDPVAHSLSPAMHNAAIAALGIDAVYVAARTTPEALPALVHAMLEEGGALNVTVPFKRQAAALVTRPTERVARTGACNTIWGRVDEVHGDNTDVVGVRTAARALLGGLSVRRVIVLGTGGSARAVAVAITEEWPDAKIRVVSRDAKRGRAFATWAKRAHVRCSATRTRPRACDLLVNATPLGLGPEDPLPMPEEDLRRSVSGAVLDLVYARGETRLARAARAMGLRAADGRGVLVAQGAAAFERFFGVLAPVEIMRAAVEDALRP
jgi:shikimate dehydrogenase